MKINTSLKILMCTSALVFAGVSTASAHQHEAGEAAATQMKDEMKDKAVDMATEKAEGMAKEKAKDMMKPEEAKAAGGINKPTDAIKDAVTKKATDGASATMKEKATDMAMDKAKGMAKEKVLGTAGAGVAGQVEHKMKEKAMDHAMDKAEGKMMDHSMKDGATTMAKEEKMSAPASMEAAPAAKQPMKLLSFDEALSVCRANANANLQACIDERTGQGALRKQLNGS